MRCYSCMLLLFACFGLRAQQPLYTNYQHFDSESGLPQNVITDIAEDEDGFIWFATLDGLARYDGKSFMIFQNNPNAVNKIKSNAIINFKWDSITKKFLIYYSDRSLQKFDPRTFKVESIELQSFDQGIVPFEIYDYLNLYNLWSDGKNFLSLYIQANSPNTARVTINSEKSQSEKWNNFFRAQGGLSKKTIYDIAEDNHGQLWVLTAKGLEVSDSLWRSYTKIDFNHNTNINLNERLNHVKIKIVDLDNQRLAIIKGYELIIYNKASKTFQQVAIDSHKGKTPGKSNHTPFTFDKDKNLVVEYRGSIYRLDKNNRVRLLWKTPSDHVIRDIHIDHSNTLWVGTDMGGLYKVNLQKGQFVSKKYKDSFMLDVIANEFELTNSGALENMLALRNAFTLRYFYTPSGDLIFESEPNENKNNFDVFVIQNSKISALPNNATTHGIAGKGHGESFYLLDSNNKLYKWSASLLKLVASDSINLPFPRNSSYDESLRVIDLITGEDFLWVVTKGKGIHLIQNNTVTRSLQLPFANPINTAHLDADNQDVLWIGTTGEGLYKWNTKSNKQLAHFSNENGLPNNAIHCIIPDSLGYFWMSTNRGITRFNPKTETFTNFFTEDGLYESEFNRHHALMLPDGRIAFGGTNGYSIFHPKDFLEDTTEPKVYITRFAINDKEADHRIDSILLSKPITQAEHVELDHDQNSLEFQFAALQYNAPEKIKYRYQLAGYDKDWVMLGGDNKVRFSQLPFGEYKLRLNATNTIGSWSPHVRELSVIVHPPIWLTWWAFLFYAFIIGLGIRYYWRAYRKRLIAKQEIEFNLRETKRLKELDETKTRFFSNITHEFRTPLTLILSPLEKHLNDASLQPQALAILNNNYRHASQLLRLVNQLLDISKLESGQMQQHATAGELRQFIENCFSAFQGKASDKNLQFELSITNIDGNYLFDHDKLQKILSNLISNAIKFTGKGGVMLAAKQESENAIVFEVADTGIGMEENQLPKIFDRFYQVDDSLTRNYEGTGIGLSLVKELVVLLGGNITTDSKVGQGSIFKVILPIQKLKEFKHAESLAYNNLKIPEDQKFAGINNEQPVILVIEDNTELREFIKESLKANWVVFDASNGIDGWAIIERELPEIVITDLMMPGMNGIELCAKAKNDMRTNHINFIILTAKAAQESKIEGLQAGAEVYITKPFHLYELELQIRNLLFEQHNLRIHLQKKNTSLVAEEIKSTHCDPFIQKLDTFLSQQIDNSLLGVDMVAEAMAMSRSTLNRKMKAILNTSVNDYIKMFRLKKAAAFLAEGMQVNEVAWKVGFESSSYFTQCFKDFYQKTPTEFRQGKVDSKLK